VSVPLNCEPRCSVLGAHTDSFIHLQADDRPGVIVYDQGRGQAYHLPIEQQGLYD